MRIRTTKAPVTALLAVKDDTSELLHIRPQDCILRRKDIHSDIAFDDVCTFTV